MRSTTVSILTPLTTDSKCFQLTTVWQSGLYFISGHGYIFPSGSRANYRACQRISLCLCYLSIFSLAMRPCDHPLYLLTLSMVIHSQQSHPQARVRVGWREELKVLNRLFTPLTMLCGNVSSNISGLSAVDELGLEQKMDRFIYNCFSIRG